MSLLPTKKQLEFLDWEFGIFFHFGIRSFNPGRRDWDGVEMAPETFCPESLDCLQWCRAAKEAGAKYAILTTKHHDGFALWPSAYSRYSVKDTPWRDGKGDVVREFVDACRSCGLKVGLYYSPAQWGSRSISFDNDKAYDHYFISQIGELLTGYGAIDYLWFDGCGSEGHVFDYQRIVDEIYCMQPDILTFCDPEWMPGVRWIGNEDGYASLNNPLVVSATDFSMLSEKEQRLSNPKFLPAECDCKIRSTWFYDLNEETLKSTDELFGMYEMSVGHGSNFLLNIGPDNRGLLPEKDVQRLLELGQRIRCAYGTPLDYSSMERQGDTYTISHNDLGPVWDASPRQEYLSNTLVLEEDLSGGAAVESFRIYAYLPDNRHKKILVFRGSTIGHKVICRFSTMRASRYEVEIVSASKPHTLKAMRAYCVR